MLKFFRHIRIKLIDEDNVRKYLLYAIGEILLNLLTKTCPVRDYLSVELMNAPRGLRAVRYDICRENRWAHHHIAYLRHAGFWAFSFFYYRYIVPTGQIPVIEFLNPINPILRQSYVLQARFPC